MTRLKYLLTRTLSSIVVLWIAITFLWLLFRFMPGDYTSRMIFSGASPETIAAFEERWGLNEPLHVQYWTFLTNLLAFEAGTSFQFRSPVWEVVNERVLNSLILILPGITAAYIAGTIIGTLLGRVRGSRIERYGFIPILITGTFPSFFLAMVLVIIFANTLGWFPTSGMYSIGADDVSGWKLYFSWDFLHHYILPFTAVFLRYLFLPTMIMRTSVVETLGQDFMQYHKLTGIGRVTRIKHLGKNSILPIITMFPISTTRAIGGLVLIEVVFNWPGIGNTLVNSVLARDYPVVQFIFIIIAVYIIVANLIVDIVYGVIDPRVTVDR